MSEVLLPLCSIGKIATRDGYTGATARLLLPFYTYGYWFASGQQYVWNNALVAQDTSMTINGTQKPNTFMKDCCSCANG